MLLHLLELWTVSAGVLLAVWYILLSNAAGGVYLSSFSLVYLLMSWYLESRTTKKSLDRTERSVGLWCSLLLPLVSMLSSREDDHFLPLTVSVVFVHYTWSNPDTIHFMRYPATVLLLVQAGVILTFGVSVALLLFVPVFCVLYGATQRHLSQSFTVGEGAIVSQLISHFGYKIADGTVQHVLGQHTEVVDKAIAVIFISVSIATVLYVCTQLKWESPLIFYLIFGMIVCTMVLPSLAFIIKWDGIKSLLGIVFKNKKSIMLFLWWICCSVMSIYIVMFYGKQSSPSSKLPPSETSTKTYSEYSVKQNDDLMINKNDAGNLKLSHDQKPSASQLVSMKTKCETTTNSFSCRQRKADISLDNDLLEINPSVNKIDAFESQTRNNGSAIECCVTQFTQISSRVRKLFHLVMIGVYIPGLLLNTSALYLASVVALAVLIVLELVRVYRVPPLGPALEQYFSVFLDHQDSGGLILTPVYLLVGCSLPLWFSHSNGHADLKLYAGIISIGVGDAAASLVGQRIGKHRWPGSKKTIEGTIGAITFQLILIVTLQTLSVPGSSISSITVISVILVSCLEAFSGHIDNLVVSVFAFMLFSTAGTFI